jgi:hypothetical protein
VAARQQRDRGDRRDGPRGLGHADLQQQREHHRWKRSDGTVSADLEQRVAKGTKQVDVVLLWAFNGQGTTQATATLDVFSPGAPTAATTFRYVCD